MALTYEPIFTTTLTSNATIDITSIPSTYTDLILSAVLQTTPVQNNILFSMNNISTSTYNYSNFSAVNGTINYNTSSSQAEALCSNTGNGDWGAFFMDINDYTNTDLNRVFNWVGFRSGALSANIAFEQGVWMNTTSAALNRLTFKEYTYITGTTVTLWGVKEL